MARTKRNSDRTQVEEHHLVQKPKKQFAKPSTTGSSQAQTADKTWSNNNNKLWSSAAEIFDLTNGHLLESHYSYIIGSYEYLSTKRTTTVDKEVATESNESTCVKLVTTEIKTEIIGPDNPTC